MNNKLQFNNKTYCLERYPKTEDKSLRAWSNAEILALDFIADTSFEKVHFFNDRFGVWNCALQNKNTTTVWTYVSQKKAILQNLERNNYSTAIDFKIPLDNLNHVELALIKIPKSLELFELFLAQIHKASSEKTTVVCCFMTKYFSGAYLKIASEYFEGIEQSKAWKKARLLVLSHPKKTIQEKTYINTVIWKSKELKQYYGVFSSNKIDIGTQFLLENLNIQPTEKNILDVASGNGVIAFDILNNKQDVNLTLVDDFNLAVASSRINLPTVNTNFICDNNLSEVEDGYYDLVVSNPPFHFEHENNIEITLSLFEEIKTKLHAQGRFVLVANKHLNYKTHLLSLFKTATILAVNSKFIVYDCRLI